jgi:hypothetical protein
VGEPLYRIRQADHVYRNICAEVKRRFEAPDSVVFASGMGFKMRFNGQASVPPSLKRTLQQAFLSHGYTFNGSTLGWRIVPLGYKGAKCLHCDQLSCFRDAVSGHPFCAAHRCASPFFTLPHACKGPGADENRCERCPASVDTALLPLLRHCAVYPCRETPICSTPSGARLCATHKCGHCTDGIARFVMDGRDVCTRCGGMSDADVASDGVFDITLAEVVEEDSAPAAKRARLDSSKE